MYHLVRNPSHFFRCMRNVESLYVGHRCYASLNDAKTGSAVSVQKDTAWRATANTFEDPGGSLKGTECDAEKCYKRLDLSFTDTETAFKNKSYLELFRAYCVLKLCSFESLVNNNALLMKWARNALGERLFKAFMRATFFGHFVAGENVPHLKPVCRRMRRFGVKSALDYSVEKDLTSEEAVKTTKESLLSAHSEKKAVNVPGAQEDLNTDLVEPKEASKLETTVLGLNEAEEDLKQFQTSLKFGDRRVGVVSARTYFYEGEEECDRNMDMFRKCVEEVAEVTDGAGFTAVKLTALGRPQFLLHLSEVVAQTQQFYRMLTSSDWSSIIYAQLSEDGLLSKLEEFGIKTDSKQVKEWFAQADFDANGFVDLYEWGRVFEHNFRLGKMFKVLNLKSGRLEPLMANLTEDEERQFRNMMARLQRLADFAAEKGVRLMVDAEQTYFQPAISKLTLELMRKYNKDTPVVFNTYQCYLKHALNQVKLDLHLSDREDFSFCAKIVRGAYMTQERERAQTLGYEDPINENFEETTAMYNAVIDAILEEVKRRRVGKLSVMCATHNEDTIRSVVKLMRDAGISPSQKILCFGQLYGMADHVSFSLGQAGYSVYKYVPYGPIEDVLPYLSRRMQENSGVVLKAQRERSLMARELKRRLLPALF